MTLVLFDLDDTLLAGDCEKEWVDFMDRESMIKDKFFKEKMSNFHSQYKSGDLNLKAYVELLLSPIMGMQVKEIENKIKPFARKVTENLTDDVTLSLLLKHQEHNCIVVSGTLSFLVKEISKNLGIRTYFGTDPEIKNKRFTGRILGKPNFENEKVVRVKNWINSKDHYFKEIYAYSDSIYDLPMLDFSTKAIALDPDAKLRKECEKKNWEIIERKKTTI